jgi:flagellar basal body-associated protein FliL
MYYIKNDKKVKANDIGNFEDNDTESGCGKWIYIICGIIILLIAILLIYFIFGNKDKSSLSSSKSTTKPSTKSSSKPSTKSSTKSTTKSSGQQFGFRFY